MTPSQIESWFSDIKLGYLNNNLLQSFISLNIENEYSDLGHPHYTFEQFLREAGLLADNEPYYTHTHLAFFTQCSYCSKWTWLQFIGEDDNCPNCAVTYCDHCGETYLTSEHHSHDEQPIEIHGAVVPSHSPHNPPGTHSPDGLIRGYFDKIAPIVHGKPVKDSEGKAKAPVYGIEFEVERAPEWPKSLHADILKCMGKTYAMLKRDGSLSNGGQAGFEIVAAPATFDWLMSDNSPWLKFFRDFTPFLAYDPGTTGMHIHIDINCVTPLEVGKISNFINNPVNLPFLEWVADRKLSDNEYTLLRPDREPTIILKKTHRPNCPTLRRNKNGLFQYEPERDPWRNLVIKSFGPTFKSISRCTCEANKYDTLFANHHDALNLNTNLPTFELRIFKGKMDPEFFFSCIEFTDALINFTKVTNKRNMIWGQFINWFESTMPRKYRRFNKRLRGARASGLMNEIREEAFRIEEKMKVAKKKPLLDPVMYANHYNDVQYPVMVNATQHTNTNNDQPIGLDWITYSNG